MTDDELARMTPEQLGLEVLVPLIASTGSMSREPQTIAMLLEHREPTFGRDLDVEIQAGIDWLIANGYITRDPGQSSGEFLTLTRKGRQRGATS